MKKAQLLRLCAPALFFPLLFGAGSDETQAAAPTVDVFAVPDEGVGPLEVRIVVRAADPDGLPMFCKLSYRGDSASPFEEERWFVAYPPFPELVFTHTYDSSTKDYLPTVMCQGGATVSDSSPVTVHVAPTNAAPQVALTAPTTAWDASRPVPVVLDASDADGDTLDCTVDWGEIRSQPTDIEIAAPHPDRTMQHSYRQPGRYRAQALCSDGRGGSSQGQATFDIVASAGNSNPTLDLYRIGNVIGVAPHSVRYRVQSIGDSTSDTLSCYFDAKDGKAPKTFTIAPPYSPVEFPVTYTEEIELAYAYVYCSDGRGGFKDDKEGIVINLPAGNAVPNVDLTSSVASGASPLAAQLTVRATDANGDVLHCELDYGFDEGSERFDVRVGDPARTFQHAYEKGNLYQARVVCADDKGGHDDSARWIDVDPFDPPSNYAPIVRLKPSKTSGPASLGVSFFVSGADPEGGDVACDVEFGDGYPGKPAVLVAPLYSPVTITHTYFTAATEPYVATLTCRDEAGRVSTKSAAIEVQRAANAAAPRITAFQATPTQGAAPLTVSFRINADDADSTTLNCTLDHGDGDRVRLIALDPVALTRSHVYAAGQYTARLYCCDDVPGTQFCGPSNLGVASAAVNISAAHVVRCGDGRIDAGEECDDGNTTSGDGCSATCNTEPPPPPDDCPNDPAKTEPGICGCGLPDSDSDRDGVADCQDECPTDPAKSEPGACGCGVSDADTDGDGSATCDDACPADPAKTAPGVCGCGVSDADTDGDGGADCGDACPNDPAKSEAGLCGCGVADTDSDGDGTPDCHDGCADDPAKSDPGICGCGVADADTDGDGTPECGDLCPGDPAKSAPGVCGCGVADADTDGDEILDCQDGCPADPAKTEPGICGCGQTDRDTDGDEVADCRDTWPEDPARSGRPVFDRVSAGGDWIEVQLPERFQHPVVIAGIPSMRAGGAGVAQLRNVGPDSFEIRFAEWTDQDGVHTAERIPYLVIEAGRHAMEDGTTWEAGTFTLDRARRFSSRFFVEAMADTPVLLLSAQTANATEPVTMRARYLNPAGYQAAMFEEERFKDGVHPTETVGYLAVHAPFKQGIVYSASQYRNYFVGSSRVDSTFQPVGEWLVKVEEDASYDSESTHALETISTLSIEGKLFGQVVTFAGYDPCALRYKMP